MKRQLNMTKERYRELQRNMESRLTPQEQNDGWIFCNCEWDGMLIHKSDPEAECCSCLRKLFKD
jgi:hypothetical protein